MTMRTLLTTCLAAALACGLALGETEVEVGDGRVTIDVRVGPDAPDKVAAGGWLGVRIMPVPAPLAAHLKTRGAGVMVMTPEEHDEMMAVILGLSHFIAIVSADTLVKIDGLKKMETVSGVTFKVLLTLVESVLSEDPELYASLQMNLPHLPEMQDMFGKISRQWASVIKSGDREMFIKRMNELKSRLEAGNPDFGKAYDNMYKLSDWL